MHITDLPIVLVHGGGFDSRCWDLLLPHLDGPALAVDLPGRGAHPMPLDDVSFAACAESVRDDIDEAGFKEVMLVGHSLAGCSMPSMLAALGERARQAVFVGCTVPDDGRSAFDMLDPAFQAQIRATGDLRPGPMDPDIAKIVLGNDLTDEQFAWCAERLVAEAPRLSTEPVDLSPLRASMPRTWLRTLNDVAVPAAMQLSYAENVGDCPVIDLDAGHMCMVSQPSTLARILNELSVPA